MIIEKRECICHLWSAKTKKNLKSQFAPTHSKGNRYRYRDGEEYLLVFAGKYFLVSLKDGNWWSKGGEAEDCYEITQAEFKVICGSEEKAKEFTLIHERKD